MMIANLRATATIAFLVPTLLASFMPQTFRLDHFLAMRRWELAASYNACLSSLSPHLLMCPDRSISPLAEAHDGADARDRHQPPTHIVLARHLRKPPVNNRFLFAHQVARL